MERITVVKIGGNVIDNPAAMKRFLKEFAALEGPKILVHGGGKLATRLAERLELKVQMVDGRRITDKGTLDVVTMAYAGLINKQAVAGLQAAGCNALGLSGADGNAVTARRRSPQPVDYGVVGDIERVDSALLRRLREDGMAPVFSAIMHDGKGTLLNCTADSEADDNHKEEIYTEINNNERIIDSIEVKIRNEVINMIVLYSPRATNLRMIISYYDMTAYLERIGDLILNVSHFMKKIAVDDCLFTTYKKDLLKMLSLTESMTQNAIFAFTCEDIQLAKETIETDDQVDELHHFIGQHLPTQCFDKILSQQEVTDALCINSMAYNIERIGDNATNIAEAAIYLIEGKNIKHWPKPDEDLLLAGSEG